MKRWVAVAMVMVVLSPWNGSAREADEDQGSNAGRMLYLQHEFDEAIKVCEGKHDFQSRLVMALSHAERYRLYRTKTDRDKSRMFLKILSVDADMSHVPVIEKFLLDEDNPGGNKEATKLLKEAFEHARTPHHVLMVARFLDPKHSVNVSKLALLHIKRRLQPVRDYVSQGGTMPRVERELFADPNLVRPLVGALKERATKQYARRCLVLIEEPALQYLQEPTMSDTIADTVVDIKKAMERRGKKHPGSTWCSAYGE